MSRNISVGIDVGTYHVKVVVCQQTKKSGFPKIIGTGYAQSKGLRYGYIINSDDIKRSLKKALRMAEKAAGVQIKDAWVSIGGVSLDAIQSRGKISVSRVDNEVTELDLEKVVEESERVLPRTEIANKKILHSIPITYYLDGREVLGRPIGLKGSNLEVKTLFVMCLEQHLHDLVQAIEEVGVDVIDVIAAPLAASIVMLTKAQKIAGCVLANIGSETVSIAVFENNIPISLAVFPTGSNDITNDIALGLQVPLEEAEQIKLGGITGADVSKQKLDKIVVSRLKDIFELVESHLVKIERDRLLPAGIILTGGGSGLTTIEDLAKATLELPSKIGKIDVNSGKTKVKDASWSVAYGLCVLGLAEETESQGLEMLKGMRKRLVSWFKQFLP